MEFNSRVRENLITVPLYTLVPINSSIFRTDSYRFLPQEIKHKLAKNNTFFFLLLPFFRRDDLILCVMRFDVNIFNYHWLQKWFFFLRKILRKANPIFPNFFIKKMNLWSVLFGSKGIKKRKKKKKIYT